MFTAHLLSVAIAVVYVSIEMCTHTRIQWQTYERATLSHICLCQIRQCLTTTIKNVDRQFDRTTTWAEQDSVNIELRCICAHTKNRDSENLLCVWFCLYNLTTYPIVWQWSWITKCLTFFAKTRLHYRLHRLHAKHFQIFFEFTSIAIRAIRHFWAHIHHCFCRAHFRIEFGFCVWVLLLRRTHSRHKCTHRNYIQKSVRRWEFPNLMRTKTTATKSNKPEEQHQTQEEKKLQEKSVSPRSDTRYCYCYSWYGFVVYEWSVASQNTKLEW